jgi:coenzyme F420-reducing hydrogenase beta subunit
MKSARFIESFAWQMNVPVQEIKRVEFRYKDPNRPANWYNAMLTLRDGTVVNKDWWHLADGDWGAGFFMNSACNYCDDVVAETADISFGDAWVEPYSSDGKGTNVVVVRSPKVAELISNAIREGRLQLEDVDAKFVEQTQAAGFRQRREGLAYRLSWGNKGVQPIKRVPPDATTPTRGRKLIYRMRYHISAGSNRMFSIARQLNKPALYIRWARMAAAIYHGLAYHRGKVGAWVKKFGLD